MHHYLRGRLTFDPHVARLEQFVEIVDCGDRFVLSATKLRQLSYNSVKLDIINRTIYFYMTFGQTTTYCS